MRSRETYSSIAFQSSKNRTNTCRICQPHQPCKYIYTLLEKKPCQGRFLQVFELMSVTKHNHASFLCSPGPWRRLIYNTTTTTAAASSSNSSNLLSSRASSTVASTAAAAISTGGRNPPTRHQTSGSPRTGCIRGKKKSIFPLSDRFMGKQKT